MSINEAAAIPQAAMLAVQGLIDTGKIHPGQKLLINGAGGGVGTFAVAGKVKPVIDGPYKLDEIHKAFRIFGKGGHQGKSVIAI